MTSAIVDVCVVGAGVIGLTTAVLLAEAGLTVRVVARELPPDTDSCAAGAMWGPFLTDDPRTGPWAADTLAELLPLASAPEKTGVREVHGIEAAREHAEPHDLLRGLPGFAECRPDELPAGFVSGWRYRTASVDMPLYSEHLRTRLLETRRAEIVAAEVRRLDELRHSAGLVVNCTGSSARTLVPDRLVTPMLGRVVVVENPGIEEFFAEAGESHELTWFVPHGSERVVLGSTLEPRPAEDPDALCRRIVDRCAAIEPLLAGVAELGRRAGFRPVRPEVRLETDGDWLIHNYGHGGSGVSLSWACAREVLRLVAHPG